MSLSTITDELKLIVETITSYSEAKVGYNPSERTKMDSTENHYNVLLGSSTREPFSNHRDVITQDFVIRLTGVFGNEKTEGDALRQTLISTLIDYSVSIGENVAANTASIGAIDIGSYSTPSPEFEEDKNLVIVDLTIPIKYIVTII